MAKKEIKLSDRDAQAKALGALATIKVDDNGVEKVLYIKRPNRYAIGIYYAKRDVNRIDAFEFLLKNTVIEKISDMEILSPDRDDLFLAAATEADIALELLDLKKSSSQRL